MVPLAKNNDTLKHAPGKRKRETQRSVQQIAYCKELNKMAGI